jgi:hypothetical protein
VHRLSALLELLDQFVDPLDGQRIETLSDDPAAAINSDL